MPRKGRAGPHGLRAAGTRSALDAGREVLALVTPVGADSDTVLRALFRVKAFARTTGADLQSIDEEEPDVASMLMTASLASLLEDPILYEALRGFERPSDLDGVRDIAIALYSKSRSRKRATPSADPTRDRRGYAASGEGSRRLAPPDSDSDEEASRGTRRLPPLEPSQLQRAIGPESALAIRSKAVTRAARAATAEGEAFSADLAPSDARTDVLRAILSNGHVDAEGHRTSAIAIPSYIHQARRRLRNETEDAVKGLFPRGAPFSAPAADLHQLLTDAASCSFDLSRLRDLAGRSLGANGAEADEQRELEQALRILRAVASPVATLLLGGEAGRADAVALADWCLRSLIGGDLSVGGIAAIVERVLGDYDQEVGEFIRGILRRPPSLKGALEGCEGLIQRARLEHLASAACPHDEGPSDGGGSDAEDGYDQSGSQPDGSESGDCDTDSARDDLASEQTGVPRSRFFAAGDCRQGDQCRFAH